MLTPGCWQKASSRAEASPAVLTAAPISFGWPTSRTSPSAVTVQNNTFCDGCGRGRVSAERFEPKPAGVAFRPCST